MNWIWLLSLLLSIGSDISALFMISSIRAWQNATSLSSFDRSIEFINYISLITSLITTIITYFFFKHSADLIFFLFAYLIVITSIGEFYFGFFLWYDQKGYIATLFDKWEKSINKSFLQNIQNKYHCCGFHRFNQFENDFCNASTTPCLNAMTDATKDSASLIGLAIIYHAIVHGMTYIFLRYSSQFEPEIQQIKNAQDEEKQHLLAHS